MSTRRIKVLMFTPSPLFHPGLQAMTRHQMGLAVHAKAHGVDTVMLTMHADGLPREQEVDGIRIRRLRPFYSLPKVNSFGPKYWAFKRIIAEERPDLLHERFCTLDGGTSALLRTPSVFQIDAPLEQHYSGWKLRVERALVSRLVRGVDAFFCTCEELRRYYVRQFAIPSERITVIPDGVDTRAFRPDQPSRRAELGFGGRDVVVAFVGQFYPWHGVERVIAVADRLRDTRAKFLLIGAGDLLDPIKRQVADRALQDRVVVTGRVPLAAVPEYLAAADVFIAPYQESRPDGVDFYFSPLKIYEYMAMGRPIVAPPFGQIGRVLSQETAVLVTDTSTSGYAEAVRALSQDAALRERMGRAARRAAVERHSWDRLAGQLAALYRRVLEERSAARTRAMADLGERGPRLVQGGTARP